jgi:precorrin-6B methylase 2
MSEQQPQVSPERINQIQFGYAPPLMLEAAIRLRLFDILDGGPRSVQELSQAAGASERGIRMLADALVSLDFLSKDGERYALAPESAAFLVSTRPGYQGGLFRHVSRQLIPSWLELTEVVRGGKPRAAVNQEGVGGEFFREFVEDLFPRAYPAAQVVAKTLKVAEMPPPVNVLDVAAGSAVWSIALAEASPNVRVTAVDWPAVIPVAKRVAQRQGVGDRYRYVEGDLQEADFGSGYQIATLGHILHSEGEARSRKLLRKVYDSLAPGGAIVIAEMIPNEERTGPPRALIFALNMLVNTEEGDTFTFNQMNVWLAEAGFENAWLLDAPGPSPLILARKPG